MHALGTSVARRQRNNPLGRLTIHCISLSCRRMKRVRLFIKQSGAMLCCAEGTAM